MTVEAGPVDALNLARVTQLVNKTNQFNTPRSAAPRPRWRRSPRTRRR